MSPFKTKTSRFRDTASSGKRNSAYRKNMQTTTNSDFTAFGTRKKVKKSSEYGGSAVPGSRGSIGSHYIKKSKANDLDESSEYQIEERPPRV